MNEFYCGTKIVCGSGAVAALKTLESRKLLLVSDPYFVETGQATAIAALSGAQQVRVFGQVQPDPTVALAAEGTAVLKEFAPDTVVALGGGSAMDCAKAMLYFSGCDANLVAIPTTSGSGSEVTDFAVLTHENVKHPLVDGRLAPYMAILDDELLEKLPKTLIADAGFDVLTHALEAYVAKNANSFTDALAKEAFCLAFSALPASYAGDLSVRMQVHQAATMAGVAFTRAGLGLCHAMAHVLGGIYHISHGRLNAILLPEVLVANGCTAGEKYALLGRSAGLGGSVQTVALRNLRGGLVRLRNMLRMPSSLAQAGISPMDLLGNEERIVKAVLEDPCCATNPVAVDAGTVRKILREVAGRE